MKHSSVNTIIENDGHYNRYGMYITYLCDNNTILDNYFVRNEDHGIYLESNCANNIIKGNNMESCGFYSDHYTFTYNIIDTTNFVNNGHLYFYGNRTDLNEYDFSNAGQIYLVNCNNSVISGQDLSDGSVSISLFYCNNIEISSNNLSSNSVYGINFRNCNKISILGNYINNNELGISFYCNNSIISENEVNFNLREGIYMSNCNNNSISKNNINSNGYRAGIRMFRYCSYNIISNNRFEENLYEGLSFALYSSNNTITGNVFNSNRVGVYSDSSCENNIFYLNFFINSEDFHTKGIPITSTWNTTDIGNYWDNYTGIDANDDGIGDIPHIISHSPLILDYLPIVINHAPEITIISPKPNEIFNLTSPSFNIIFESYHLESKWYTVNNGKEYIIMDKVEINQLEWESQRDGLVVLSFYTLDKIGNTGFAEINIVKDTEVPIITVTSPTPGSEFGNNAPSYSVTILDKHLDTMWYTLDGGLHNYSFTSNGTINQAAWDTILGGIVNIRFYAIDKVGNIAHRDVPIIKKQQQEFIPGYNTVILMGILLLSCTILIKIRSKELDGEKF